MQARSGAQRKVQEIKLAMSKGAAYVPILDAIFVLLASCNVTNKQDWSWIGLSKDLSPPDRTTKGQHAQKPGLQAMDTPSPFLQPLRYSLYSTGNVPP